MNAFRPMWLRHTLLALLSASGLSLAQVQAPAPAPGGLRLEGYPVSDSVTVANRKLVLSGAGVRKRGYFKTEAGALYMVQKIRTLDEAFMSTGPKRVRLVILKDVPPDTASRYFLTDFKACATPSEYKELLTEVGIIGRMYGSLAKLNAGDVVDLDWTPGQGFMPYLNGQAMLDAPLANERFYRVVLRNYIGSGAPEDYRNAMLGLTPPNATPTK